MADDAPAEGRPADGRSRPRAQTDAKIADAVLEIVRTSGPSAVTIDAVSAQSGVARTTLYRRYKDRYELLAGVAEQISPLPCIHAEPSFDGLARMIRGVQDTYESRIGLRLVGYMLASGDDFLSGWRRTVMQPRLDALDQFFARGVAIGVFRADVDAGQIVELIGGAAIFGAAVHGELPDRWAHDLAATLWPAIAA